jgi:Tol biopolymer transport system component
MRSLASQHPMLLSFRSLIARLLSLAVPLAIAACGNESSPLAPSDSPADPSGDAGAPADQAAPDFSLTGSGQRILFTSNRPGSSYYDLYKVDPLGGSLAHVTSLSGYETEPAWSFDNKQIAMVRPRKDANNVEHSDIFLMNADGSNKRWARSQTASVDIRSPSWSHDGTHLAVAVIMGGKPYLGTIEVATGNFKFVLFNGKLIQGNYPSYEPGKGRILYVNDTGRIIMLVDPVLNISYWMVTADFPMGCPQFSPDGSKIAFQMVVRSNVDVYVKTLIPSSNTVKRLTTDPGYDGVPSWSPDGSRIAFQSSRTGSSQIWVMNAATGGSQTRITYTSADEKSAAWAH